MPQVILVDESDHQVGVLEKMQAHREGVLHRAFSVLIYNSTGEMLLQQRADDKYHSAGLWTNACCSHPLPGEDILSAAHRRLKEELNLTAELKVIGSFIYQHQFENDLTEHEYDYVLIGICDDDPKLNPEEAKDFKWISKNELLLDIKAHPDNYTFWFKEMIKNNLI